MADACKETYTKDELAFIERTWDDYNPRDKPGRFVAILLGFSEEPKNYDVALEEWEPIANPDFRHDQCICSQHIENCYPYRNKLSGQELIIGSECIKKFGNEAMVINHNFIKSKDSYQGLRRRCEVCLKNKIKPLAASNVTRCKACRSMGDVPVNDLYVKYYYKECVGCGQQAIPPDRSNLYDTCAGCRYKEFMANQALRYTTKVVDCEYRPCVKCLSNNISVDEPSWKKLCLGCWRQTR